MKNVKAGIKTQTTVGILYLNNLTDKNLVNTVIAKVERLNIEGIIDSRDLSLNAQDCAFQYEEGFEIVSE